MQTLHSRFSIAPPHYTYENYKTWSGDWELIDGFPYSLMPSAKYKHQLFNHDFSRVLGNELLELSCQCVVLSDFDWIVNGDTVVRPDTMVACGKVETDWLTFPPSLILEIASSSTVLKDRNVKYKLYELHGVKYYLLADAENQKVDCYEWINGSYLIKPDRNFKFAEGCEVTLNFEAMWTLRKDA